jgi:cellulose synthase operon protein C
LNALARLYQAGGLSMQAAQTYQIVLNQSPGDVGATIGMIDAASSAGNYTVAEGAFQKGAAMAPTDHRLYIAAAHMEQSRGNDGAARRYMQRARELYVGKTMPASGGFSATNPFASRPVAGGAFGASQPVNPFALASTPARMQEMPPLAMQQNQFAMPGQQQQRAPALYVPAGSGVQAPFGFDGQGTASFASQDAGDAAISDPVLASIDRDMRSLSADVGPRVDVQTGFRSRTGEEGLSSLKELSGEAAGCRRRRGRCCSTPDVPPDRACSVSAAIPRRRRSASSRNCLRS